MNTFSQSLAGQVTTPAVVAITPREISTAGTSYSHNSSELTEDEARRKSATGGVRLPDGHSAIEPRVGDSREQTGTSVPYAELYAAAVEIGERMHRDLGTGDTAASEIAFSVLLRRFHQ